MDSSRGSNKTGSRVQGGVVAPAGTVRLSAPRLTLANWDGYTRSSTGGGIRARRVPRRRRVAVARGAGWQVQSAPYRQMTEVHNRFEGPRTGRSER